jgi:hypothetical protein
LILVYQRELEKHLKWRFQVSDAIFLLIFLFCFMISYF